MNYRDEFTEAEHRKLMAMVGSPGAPACNAQCERYGYECTRDWGHDGIHIADTGRRVCATWEDDREAATP